MDIAASIQLVLEDAVLRLTRSLAAETGLENLCLAGGVARQRCNDLDPLGLFEPR